MELLISLLIWILLFALVYYAIGEFMNLLNVPPKLQNIVKAIFLLFAIILLFTLVFGRGSYLPIIIDFK